MKNNATIVNRTDRDAISRCHCPKCDGRACTARVCFNSRKLDSLRRGKALAGTAGLVLLLSCFLLQGQARADDKTDQATENATSRQSVPVSFGYLEVFSTTEQPPSGEGPYYYVHSGYRIFDAKGKTVKWVVNHDSSTDEQPQKVELAPGKFTIWAQSDERGYVKISVMVSLARTTMVYLESDRDDNTETSLLTRKVKAPSGALDDNGNS